MAIVITNCVYVYGICSLSYTVSTTEKQFRTQKQFKVLNEASKCSINSNC